jgi:putative ubiquitin-RnfH superfamily antitoxin RatB of RatAB toxin-antitoxin module
MASLERATDRMKITVVYAPNTLQVREWLCDLPAGSTLRQALTHCGAFEEFPDLAERLATGELTAGVWGRAARSGQLLADADRVEIYRDLRVDPKVARRERAGGKAGY